MAESNGLGRLEIHDDRDTNYPARALVPDSPSEEASVALDRGYRYWWDEGWWGDQGNTPQCVAYAMLHMLEDGPNTKDPTKPGEGPLITPLTLYRGAQENDEWPGTNYAGTSARGACKWLHQKGIISEYRWAFTLDEMVDMLIHHGPVAFGTWWFDSMDRPDPDGFVGLSGRARGGHEILANGVNLKEEKIRFKNSWGRRWGQGGQFWMRFDHVRFLLERAGGDAVSIVE